ncbi:hypothetical protein ACNOYE_12150 [Nannocystaceae bacterium ST9]
MRRRSLALISLVLACLPDPEGAARDQPAKVEPAKAEPAKAEPAKVEPAKVEPAKVEPAKVEPAKVEPASVSAGMPAPSKPELLALAKPEIRGELALLAPIVEFGPRRFAAAIRSRPFADRFEFRVHALIVEADTSVPPRWSVVGELELHAIDEPALAEIDEGPLDIPTTVRGEDYDDDGELELLVRVRHDRMCPGGGPNVITTMIVVDPSPSPSVALKTELHHALGNGASETKAEVVHEDLDGDGHRDVRIRYETTSEPVEEDGAPTSQSAENRWLWQSSRDAWVVEAGPSGEPPYASWGCDW